VGVALYEGLSGVRPFVAKNYNALLVQILTASPRPIEELCSGLPRGLAEVIRTALEKRREKRFGSASEFRAALAPSRAPAMATPVAAGFGLPRVTLFPGAEDSSTASDDEPTLEMLRQPSAEAAEEDHELTEVDAQPPSFADSSDSDQALT